MRRVFHQHYPSEEAARTVLKWIPKWQMNQDPSGRASQIHLKTIEKPQHPDLCAVEPSIVIESRKAEIS